MSSLSSENTQKYFGLKTSSSVFKNTTGTQEVVSPADNTDGIVVFSACTSTAIGAANAAVVSFKSSTPSGFLDGHHLAITNTSTNGAFSNNLNTPVLVPAGNGLYLYCSSSSTNATVLYQKL
jgi:hypothetical protein